MCNAAVPGITDAESAAKIWRSDERRTKSRVTLFIRKGRVSIVVGLHYVAANKRVVYQAKAGNLRVRMSRSAATPGTESTARDARLMVTTAQSNQFQGSQMKG